MFQDERDGAERNKAKQYGKYVGFIFAAVLCSVMLFLILTLTKKIPVSWSYIHILGILGLILMVGWYLNKR